MFGSKKFGIKTWLFLLAAFASLPLLAFCGYLIFQIGLNQKLEIESSLTSRAQSIAYFVNQRLETSLGYLNSLASSDAALNNDIPELYEHAKRVVKLNPGVVAISLVSKDQQLVFLTSLPLDAQRIPANDIESAQIVFETGKPAVSKVFKAPISERMVVTIGVPIFQEGAVKYCLRMVMLTDSFHELLMNQKVDSGWTIWIFDRDNFTISRSRQPEKYVGKYPSPSILKALKDNRSGRFEAVTLEGIEVRAAVVNVQNWDWKVAIGVPVETLNAPVNNALKLLMIFGSAVLLISTIFSGWLSRYILGHFKNVVLASSSVQHASKPLIFKGPVKEFDMIVENFAQLGERERSNKEMIKAISEKHEAASQQLEHARLDPLTSLPGRSLFLERASELHSSISRQSSQSLILMFIDLDGFKAVNDTLGHEEGDRILIRTADVIKGLIRDTDVAGRLGGDEFVICLKTDIDQLLLITSNIAERIIQRVSDLGSGIGCSIGISVWSDANRSLSEVLKQADLAMYEAKRAGKNRYVLFGADAMPTI